MTESTAFVSHAYGDNFSLQRLLETPLPNAARPFVFPPITVRADQRVSDDLMTAIRHSDALVYIATPASLASFWVAFERNYALRLGKPVYAFDPASRSLGIDVAQAQTPPLSINWNMAIRQDCLTVRDIALHLFDTHNLDIHSDLWRQLDNDFRQMLDSFDGLRGKIAEGGIVLLFPSNASILEGWHDWLDPFTQRRMHRDCETPSGYTSERFSIFPRDRTLTIWLDPPDRVRIGEALDRLDRTRWDAYADVVRDALAAEAPCVVSDGATINWNRVDDVMVRLFHLAYATSEQFRASVSRGPPPG